ncbi:MAG: HDOD domain-containing protein [Gammaproteobacteria bacterium]|nr:HDOD domain-containing protein [Gammaproteobacteria bacterium]
MFDIDQQKAEEITKNFEIPVKPQILVEIQDVQASQDPSPRAFADIISKDVALSAAVLKTINSPVFGLKRKITDIRQSVGLLGTQNIINLVSFFQLKQAFNKKSAISHEKYWDTARETANMMSLLVEELSLQSQCPIEDAYAFGLFRDCGIPPMAMKFDDYRAVLIEANAKHEQVFTDIEEAHYQTNHAIIGYFVASSWNLPIKLCQLILRHHEPDYLRDKNNTDLSKHLYVLAKLASNILAQYVAMKDDSEWLLAKDDVLGYFGLSDLDYADLEQDLKEVYKIQFG